MTQKDFFVFGTNVKMSQLRVDNGVFDDKNLVPGLDSPFMDADGQMWRLKLVRSTLGQFLFKVAHKERFFDLAVLSQKHTILRQPFQFAFPVLRACAVGPDGTATPTAFLCALEVLECLPKQKTLEPKATALKVFSDWARTVSGEPFSIVYRNAWSMDYWQNGQKTTGVVPRNWNFNDL